MKLCALVLVLVSTLAACDTARDAPVVASVVDLDGRRVDPLAGEAATLVLIFTRTDCPISNRAAPEVRRLVETFGAADVTFRLVYPDPDTSPGEIRTHLRDYAYPCEALRDPAHELVDLVGATVTPEAAVFAGPERRLVYLGRIDDRYQEIGKARPAPTRRDLDEALGAITRDESVPRARTRAVGCPISDLRRR